MLPPFDGDIVLLLTISGVPNDIPFKFSRHIFHQGDLLYSEDAYSAVCLVFYGDAVVFLLLTFLHAVAFDHFIRRRCSGGGTPVFLFYAC